MRHFRPHLEKRLDQMTRSDDPKNNNNNNNNKSSLPSFSRSLAPSTIPRVFIFLFSILFGLWSNPRANGNRSRSHFLFQTHKHLGPKPYPGNEME